MFILTSNIALESMHWSVKHTDEESDVLLKVICRKFSQQVSKLSQDFAVQDRIFNHSMMLLSKTKGL